MTEEQYAELYFREVQLNRKAFNAVISCGNDIRKLAQLAYDLGHNEGSAGLEKTTIVELGAEDEQRNA